MELLYTDARIVVCLKPAGVLSTDEPGGMPELLRRALGEPETGCVRTVHRLDRPVGGVMVFARSRMADSLLSRQVQAHTFEKDYLAVLEGVPAQASGVLEDQLRRDTAARRTCVADAPGPDTRPARIRVRRGFPTACWARKTAARSSSSGWRPGARTRSARSSLPAGCRCAATRNTARPRPGRSGCGRTGSRSATRRRAGRCSFPICPRQKTPGCHSKQHYHNFKEVPMARTKELDMLNGALLPKLMMFSLPLALTGILQLLFNAADVIVVGKFAGSTSLAAVGATSALINLLTGAFIGCRDDAGVSRAVHSAITLSLLLGVVTFLLGFFLSTPMLELMGTPDDVLRLASLYLRIYFIGIPGALIYNFAAAILRAYGDTKRPLLFLAVSGVLNVFLNLFFVIVCRLDVAGVAIATVVSQYVSVVLILVCLMRQTGPARLNLRQLRLHPSEALRMIQIGLPAGLQSVVFNISNVMVQSCVNSFGADVIAANTASANIAAFTYTAMNAVFHAAITFTSQNLGARRYDRIWKIFWNCQLTVMLIGVPLCVLSTVFGPQLLSIYVSADDPARDAVIAMGMIRTYYVTTPYFLCGIMEVCCGMVRGLGKSWLPMVVTIFGACVMRIVWIYTIFAWKHTLPALYVSYPISWVITAAMHVVCFVYFWKRIRRKLEQTAPAAADIRKES